MQTVTNLFITNLAMSDLIVNFTSLWVTPLYTYLGRWVLGAALCHAVPLFQGFCFLCPSIYSHSRSAMWLWFPGTSIFISSLTLTAVAIDRHLVIVSPFRRRMSRRECLALIGAIWLLGLMLVAPYAVHMALESRPSCAGGRIHICLEQWAHTKIQLIYGLVVLALQFGLPFLVISFCYGHIWISTIRRCQIVFIVSSKTSWSGPTLGN